jgi:catechol 2,3-dioxygenase-like lactoylglutathione lyase family enzyme
MRLNHAMMYVSDVPRAVEFYANKLGLEVLFQVPGYARVKFPVGDGTLALHAAEPGHGVGCEGTRLYFEVEQLDAFCDRLEARGVVFKQKPKDMPWGWRHAYLDDPDGHELSLYWAGDQRLKS